MWFTVLVWNRSILLTSRNGGRTFKGEIYASKNQNTARLNGETDLVSQKIILFKTDGMVNNNMFEETLVNLLGHYNNLRT